MPTYTRLLILVPLGFIAAVAAAGVITAIGLFGIAEPGHPVGLSFFVAKWMAILIGVFAFVPWVVAVILAVTFGFRSAFYWFAVGGGIGAAGYVFGGLPDEGSSGSYSLAIHLLAGFVGGLLYWLIGVRAVGSCFVPLADRGLD